MTAMTETTTPSPAFRRDEPHRSAGPVHTTAVIVHWGRVEATARLAAHLDEMSRVEAVVVVANDGAARPATLPTTAEWLVPRANLGFAGGFRLGVAAHPDSDAYLLMNNDVWLPERTLDACLDLLARDGVGIVGPTLLNADGIHPGPERLTPLFAVPRRRCATPPGEPADVAFVTGAILLIRAECHRQVPMDTRYFLAYEEADLAWRAKAAGWRVVVSPYQAWHTAGGVIPGDTSTYFTTRNRIWFARVHGGRRRGVAVALCLALGALPRSAGSDLLRGRGVARCRFAWQGLLDGIGPLPPIDRPFPDEPRPARWEKAHRPRADRVTNRTEIAPAAYAREPAGPAGSAGLADSAGPAHSRRATQATDAAPLTGGVETYLTLATELGGDLRRIAAVAGPAAAARFAVAAAAHAPAVARTHQFDAADRAMAGRDWTFRPQPGVRIRLPGTAFGGARKTYCRSVYAARPGYAPAPGESVVDLGANQGLFSVLAASAGASRVLAVEARGGFAPKLAANAAANGVADRIEFVHARVGSRSEERPVAEERDAASERCDAVPRLRLADLLDRHGLRRVDLMKIDIEGAEFALFDEPGWLDRVSRIVMEVHPQHGDPATLQRALAAHGFASQLMDHDLAPAPTLLHASAGYLYARQQFTSTGFAGTGLAPASRPPGRTGPSAARAPARWA